MPRQARIGENQINLDYMFTLIELPYAMEALAPVISAETLSFHHGKHLQAYEMPGGQVSGIRNQ